MLGTFDRKIDFIIYIYLFHRVVSKIDRKKFRFKRRYFDLFRLWILLTAFLLITIIASDAKKSGKDVEYRGNNGKQKKTNVEYRTK